MMCDTTEWNSFTEYTFAMILECFRWGNFTILEGYTNFSKVSKLSSRIVPQLSRRHILSNPYNKCLFWVNSKPFFSPDDIEDINLFPGCQPEV